MLNKTADQWLENVVKRIVDRHGGETERHVLSQPHTLERDSDTWNDDHRVVNVCLSNPGSDNYRDGFAVDLVTGTICG